MTVRRACRVQHIPAHADAPAEGIRIDSDALGAGVCCLDRPVSVVSGREGGSIAAQLEGVVHRHHESASILFACGSRLKAVTLNAPSAGGTSSARSGVSPNIILVEAINWRRALPEGGHDTSSFDIQYPRSRGWVGAIEGRWAKFRVSEISLTLSEVDGSTPAPAQRCASEGVDHACEP